MSNKKMRFHKNKLTHALNNNRALFIFIILFTFLSLTAPRFLTVFNITTILKGASLNAICAIGFTIIFILGQLDLSIGAVVMLCGMLTIGLKPSLGWTGSITFALLSGAAIGLANGLLVVKAKINSFIVTLGMLTTITGVMHLYSGGGSLAVKDYGLTDWIDDPVIPFLPPRVIITLALVLGFSFFLNKTRWGRRFFLVGGNPESAFLSGIKTGRYIIAGFIICSTTAALGGALFAVSLSAMTSAAILGTRTLMTVLAGVIIGGALMTGGKGSVVKSFFAVLLLTTLFNGIGCFGLGFEKQIFANGLILAVVVLYEAYAIYSHNLLKGRRPDLLKELPMQPGKKRFLIPCFTLTAILCVVVITTIVVIHIQTKEKPGSQIFPVQKNSRAIEKYVLSLKGTDHQPLIIPGSKKEIPPRPADPESLGKDDKGYWWDIEYAGWKTKKVPMPESPGDGPSGKRIVLLKAGDHPYWTAFVHGFKTMATAYGMKVKIFNSNWNIDLQAQQTDQAINERPGMIIFAPVDATACTPLLRRINKAGVPCIACNTIPCDQAMKYCLAWTGPDDWGQFRMLTREFADALGKKGDYAIVRHMPGSSCFFARTYAPVTELKEYAPDMNLLVMDSANLETEGTMQLVSAWITKYGKKLKGLILPGDGFSMTGALEAIRESGRKDIIIVAAGNSKTGMDSVQAGDALAITYQSAEGDGALAVYTAAKWFNGAKINPVCYLPKHIITKKDVKNFMPAQW